MGVFMLFEDDGVLLAGEADPCREFVRFRDFLYGLQVIAPIAHGEKLSCLVRAHSLDGGADGSDRRVCDGGKQDAEDDRHWPLKSRGEFQ